jgi:hypothetical protein
MNTKGDDKSLKYAEIRRRAAEELEEELAAMRKLYDRFGEAHIRRMVKDGISPLGKNNGRKNT